MTTARHTDFEQSRACQDPGYDSCGICCPGRTTKPSGSTFSQRLALEADRPVRRDSSQAIRPSCCRVVCGADDHRAASKRSGSCRTRASLPPVPTWTSCQNMLHSHIPCFRCARLAFTFTSDRGRGPTSSLLASCWGLCAHTIK